MMREALIQAAAAYVEDLLSGRSDGHEAAHSLRVWRTAMLLAGQDPDCDEEIVSLAALLHDVDDHKLFATENQANARAFLTGQQLSPERIERICEAIRSVSFSQNRGHRPQTREGQIVQDADRLDAIGAIGIARAFAYGGQHGRSLESSVRHFYDKLLLLKDEMNTPGGKAMAESRHAFLTAFLEELHTELGQEPGSEDGTASE